MRTSNIMRPSTQKVTLPGSVGGAVLRGQNVAVSVMGVAGARVEDAFMSGHRAMTTMLATTPA